MAAPPLGNDGDGVGEKERLQRALQCLPAFPLITQRAFAVWRGQLDVHLGRLQRTVEVVGKKAREAMTMVSGFSDLQKQLMRQNFLRTQQMRGNKELSLRAHNFAAIIPGDSVAEMVVTSSVFNFLNIYNTLLITRLVLTWFPNPPEIIANPLSTICDPYLNVFRGIIPPVGTLDLSPILAFLVLNVFTNTASALPAELSNNAGPTENLTWRQFAQKKKGLSKKKTGES